MEEVKLLQQQLENHTAENKEKFTEIFERLSASEKELGTKVSWIVFWSIVLLLVAVVGGMWGVLYREVKDVQEISNVTRFDVSYIKGQLESAEITK